MPDIELGPARAPSGGYRALGAALCVVVGLLASACSPAQSTDRADRYLYVVNCDARVDKLDTIEHTKVDSFLLSERSGSPSAVAVARDGKMDGCLAQRVLVDQQRAQVSLIAPKDARLDSAGLQDFQVLTYALPDWKLVATRPIGKLPEAPRLKLDPANGVGVLTDAQWTPITQMDLSGYAGREGDATGLIIETSGPSSLLSLLSTGSVDFAAGVADSTTHKVARLDPAPTTDFRHVHLAPGGGFVLVEVTEGNTSTARRSGALKLYDAGGRPAGDRTDARIRDMDFVALTPDGTAVYRSDTTYLFVALGRRFGTAAVVKPMPELAEPGLVYTAR